MNLADKYLAQMEELRATDETAHIFLPVPDLRPDFTFECEVRRLSLEDMMMSGLLPENLCLAFLSNNEKQADRAAMASRLTPQETVQGLAIYRKVASLVCVNPRLVYSELPGPGEIAIYTLRKEILMALYYYAIGLSVDVPVATVTPDGLPSSTTVGAVETFPAEPQQFSAVLPDGARHPEGSTVGAPAVA